GHDGFGIRAHLRNEVLADERRRHRILVLMPMLVHAHLAQLLRVADPIPYEVVAAMAEAQVVVQSGDGIADDLLPLGQEEREVREDTFARLRLEISLVRRATPNVIAGIDWLDRRRELGAHARADAVAADEDIGAFAAAASKMHGDAGAVLLHALEGVAEMVTRRIDGLAQEPLQPVPRGKNLR